MSKTLEEPKTLTPESVRIGVARFEAQIGVAVATEALARERLVSARLHDVGVAEAEAVLGAAVSERSALQLQREDFRPFEVRARDAELVAEAAAKSAAIEATKAEYSGEAKALEALRRKIEAKKVAHKVEIEGLEDNYTRRDAAQMQRHRYLSWSPGTQTIDEQRQRLRAENPQAFR
jgi:hypothetical protein